MISILWNEVNWRLRLNIENMDGTGAITADPDAMPIRAHGNANWMYSRAIGCRNSKALQIDNTKRTTAIVAHV